MLCDVSASAPESTVGGTRDPSVFAPSLLYVRVCAQFCVYLTGSKSSSSRAAEKIRKINSSRGDIIKTDEQR